MTVVPNNIDWIVTAIHNELKERIRGIVSDAADEAAENVRKLINEQVDAIALTILSRYRVEYLHNEIVIKVEKLEREIPKEDS